MFRNRTDAGQKLALKLQAYSGQPDVVVLALPRGGVPVGCEVAKALRAPIDVFVVRKLGVPWNPELAMGAVATGGVRVLDEETVRSLAIPSEDIARIAAQEERELERRERSYRGGNSPLPVAGKRVILVDDGIATGSTMRAGVAALRRLQPTRIVIAAPVAPRVTCMMLRKVADEVVCVIEAEDFFAIGEWYEDFSQLSDDEVRSLLGSSSGLISAA
ncbi:MAG TPA: phosphoribosyltransferase [Terriglobia bacterium]|jgi:predicted phosphoribosyltransferase|nr:phosphoribosyltransferase [Terriglobia bacterium]